MNELLKTNDPYLSLTRGAQIEAQRSAKLKEQEQSVANYDAIDRAAKEFEAVFLSEMLKPMFEGLKPDPMFGGGKGEDVFQGMMVQEYGKNMAENGGIGLARYIKAELLKIQEETQK